MNIVMYFIVGLIAGWVTTEISPPSLHHNFLSNTVIGMIGSFLGGFSFEILGFTTFSFWEAIGSAIVGATFFLAIVKFLSRPQNKSSIRHFP